MPRGGVRPGAGRPKGTGGPHRKDLAKNAATLGYERADPDLTPRAYLTALMQDPRVDPAIRIRAQVCCCHIPKRGLPIVRAARRSLPPSRRMSRDNVDRQRPRVDDPVPDPPKGSRCIIVPIKSGPSACY